MAVEIDEIRRSRRRTVSLEITPEGGLIVHAPLRLSEKRIRELAEAKAAWVAEKQEAARKRSEKYPPRRYLEGEPFLFLGRELRLSYLKQTGRIEARGDRLIVPARFRGAAGAAVLRWYKEQAGLFLRGRVREISEAAGQSFRSVRVTDAQTRWGSCGPENTLNFSWRLVMAPPAVIDYVVVHELCHTVHHDHSGAFWSLVESVLPDFRERMRWLKENSGLIRMEF